MAFQVGLSDLIANSEDEYVQIATDLAKNPARVAQLKTTLRDKCMATVWCVHEGGRTRFEGCLTALRF